MIPTLLTDSVSTDLERAVHYALLWGLEAVELRSVGGPRDRVPHVNEQKIRRRLLESEMPCVAVVPGMFEGDVGDRAEWLNEIALFEETLQFCARVECPRVVVSSFQAGGGEEAPVDALRKAADRASKKGITLCVLNTEGTTAATGEALARLLDAVGHDGVAAAWDPTAAAAAGEDPGRGVEAVAGRTGLVRCRNAERTGNGWEPRAIDKGAVDWAHQLARLSDAGFDGPVSMDVAVEPKAKAGLYDATTLIKLIRGMKRR